MSDFDSIIYEVADGRARITLNRPENAKFGDGRVRVNGPEFRDDEGRLTDG